MTTRKTSEQAAAPSPKGKAKIKSLRLTREAVEDLSKQDAGAIKGGANFSRGISGAY